MIEIKGTPYYLCLLDTNAVSEMVKNQSREFPSFCNWAFGSKPTYIPSFSLFTVIELRRRPNVYAKFIELFSIFPCTILKGHEELIQDEISAYPNPSAINPVLLGFGGLALSPDNRLDRALDTFFASPNSRASEEKWLAGRAEIVEGITSLVQNYPPESGTYKPSEIRTFLEIVVFQQIALRSYSFAKSKLDKGEAVQIDAFPSLKMTLFTIFYKFYVDNRKPLLSDAFDLIICAPTPYVDAIITERHQAEVIRKIKMRDGFLNSVTVKTVRDLRD